MTYTFNYLLLIIDFRSDFNLRKKKELKMAVGKNKRLTKGGKKGQKKKIVDPFTRKEWYDVRAPVMFNTRGICKTPVNKTAGEIKGEFEGESHR